jgi:hypothetical protein
MTVVATGPGISAYLICGGVPAPPRPVLHIWPLWNLLALWGLPGLCAPLSVFSLHSEEMHFPLPFAILVFSAIESVFYQAFAYSDYLYVIILRFLWFATSYVNHRIDYPFFDLPDRLRLVYLGRVYNK